MSTLAELLVVIGADTDKVDGALGKTKSLIGNFAGMAAKGLAVVGSAALALGTAGAAMGIKTAAGLEQANIAFTTLLGSGEAAEAFLGDLQSFAATTPFELPGLIDAARQLIGVGQSAESVIPTLTAWGDTAGALGLTQDQFSRAMMATTQAMSKGKVQAEELMQMTEAGIPIWPLLAKAMNKTVPELQEMASRGELLAKDVFPALEAQMNEDYGGAMAAQSKTLTGLWSTLMDTLNLGLANAILPVQDELKSGLTGAIEIAGMALAALPGIIEKVWSAFQIARNFIMNSVVPAVRSFITAIGPEMSSGASFLSSVWTGVILPIFNLISTNLQALIGWLIQNRATFESVWNAIAGFAAVVWPKILAIIQSAMAAIQAAINVAVTVIQYIWTNWGAQITAFLVTTWENLKQVVMGALTVIQGIFEVFAGLFTGDWSRLWEGIKMILSGAWSIITALVGQAWNTIKSIVSTAMSVLLTAVSNGIGAVLDYFAALPGNILSALGNLGSWLKGSGEDLLDGMLGGIVAGFVAVRDFFRELPGRVKDMLADAGEWLYEAGKDILNGLKNGIEDAVGSVTGAIGDAAGAIKDSFTGALGISSPSKVFNSFGRYLMSGLANGIGSAISAVMAIIRTVPKRIIAAFSNSRSLLAFAGRWLMAGLRDGIRSASSAVYSTLNSIMRTVASIVSRIRSMVNTARSLASQAQAAANRASAAVRQAQNAAAASRSSVVNTARSAAPSGVSMASAIVPRVVVDVTGGDADMQRVIRKWIRTDNLLQGA